MLSYRFCVLGILGLMMASAAQAAQPPEEVVATTATELIDALKTRSLTGDKKAAIKEIVDEVLSPVIDFRRIAYRSMGKYYKRATTHQFLNFTEAIKISLINTYSGPLLENDAQALANKLTVEIRDAKPIEGSRPRTLVATWLRIGPTEKYDVIYYMYLNTKKDAWLVENVSVEGIDLGITFRNQYQRLITEHNGDIDAVIAVWAQSKIKS